MHRLPYAAEARLTTLQLPRPCNDVLLLDARGILELVLSNFSEIKSLLFVNGCDHGPRYFA